MLRCAGASDAGRVRGNNEDAYWMDAERGIFLVVDGIGGHNAGEQAAAIAVERIRARLERDTGTAEQRIREAITLANNEILRAAGSNPEWRGMACVLTLAVIENGAAVVGHVGDSRLYLVRGGVIRKVTHDHSPVGEREDSGELDERAAMRHPRRNEVFRDVGSEEHAPGDAGFIEMQRVAFEEDGALLLCSDGLSDQVTSEEILEAVQRRAGDPQAAVQDLIARANAAGGKDNVTVVLAEGERFTAAAAVPRRERRRLAGAVLFCAGIAVAAAGGYLTRAMWTPPAVVIAPRTIVAGDSIAAAMAVARPGDTVEVPPGEYREQVRLKDGVVLRARTPRATTLRSAPFANGPAVVAEGVKDARLSGFRILGGAESPIATGILLRDSRVEIDDVEVRGAGVGIEIRGGGSPVLRANSIRDCAAEGILILGPARPWLSHNLLEGNKGANIAARDGAAPDLLENQEVRKQEARHP
ncbi:MAG: protein phosphatase 2C domain-containing protein [Acidobacteriota bacterium]|nr:protein phosphatase 2C domain-containing protein [Acidobacteriota bacterium]